MRVTALVSVLLAVTLPLLAAPRARAGERDAQRLQARIEMLVDEARALQAEGRHDAADVLLKRAHDLKARLEKEQREPLTMEQAEKVLHGLEMGMASLKALGRQDELKALGRVADELRARMRQARAEKGGKEDERAAVRHRIELWQEAAHAYREAERPDLVGQVERIIHAYEVMLSGRKDDEAREIVKGVPSRENQAELLGYAAHLWAGWGHETRAAALKKASQEMLGHREAPPQEAAPRAAAAREHLEALQGQMKEIREMVSKLREQIEALERGR